MGITRLNASGEAPPLTVIWNCCVSVPSEFVAATVIWPVVPTSDAEGTPESTLPESESHPGCPLTLKVGVGLPVALIV